MAVPARFTYFRIVCAFTPAPGINVRRNLLVALNDRKLFESLSLRSHAAEVAAWTDEQDECSARMVQQFCRTRYVLEPSVSIQILEMDRVPRPVKGSFGCNPANKVEGGTIWLIDVEANVTRHGDTAHGLPIASKTVPRPEV